MLIKFRSLFFVNTVHLNRLLQCCLNESMFKLQEFYQLGLNLVSQLGVSTRSQLGRKLVLGSTR